MVTQVGLVNELRLAAQIEVVRTCGSAGANHGIAMLGVGTDSRDQHPCGIGQLAQTHWIGGIDHH